MVCVCVRARGCVLIYSIDERLFLYVPTLAYGFNSQADTVQYNAIQPFCQVSTQMRFECFVVSSTLSTAKQRHSGRA